MQLLFVSCIIYKPPFDKNIEYISHSIQPLFCIETETNKQILDAFNEAGNWVGICFAVYSLVAALFSIVMPKLISLTSRKTVYAGSLVMGGIGFISTMMFSNHYLLLISMIGVGIAWAGILAMPYTILSGALPAKRMGIYMGLFNLTVVVPQRKSKLVVKLLKAAGEKKYIKLIAGSYHKFEVFVFVQALLC